jgi:hypothetical protein
MFAGKTRSRRDGSVFAAALKDAEKNNADAGVSLAKIAAKFRRCKLIGGVRVRVGDTI